MNIMDFVFYYVSTTSMDAYKCKVYEVLNENEMSIFDWEVIEVF